MRASWSKSQPMLIWLDMVENQGRFPTQREVAEMAGITASAFRVRHWKPNWIKFFKDFRAKPQYLKYIQEAAAEFGIKWDPNSVMNKNPSEIFPSRVTKTGFEHQTRIRKLAIKYLTQQV